MKIECKGHLNIEFLVFVDEDNDEAEAGISPNDIILVEVPPGDPKTGVHRIWKNEVGPENLAGYADWYSFFYEPYKGLSPQGFAKVIVEHLLTGKTQSPMNGVPFIDPRS